MMRVKWESKMRNFWSCRKDHVTLLSQQNSHFKFEPKFGSKFHKDST